MATRTLQPSEYEIQREVEALRDIRRRSTTPGALIIDPDLPNQSPATSPTTRTWPVGSAAASFMSDSDSSSMSYDRTSSDRSSHGSSSVDSADTGATSTGVTDDPFHLFWVPASVHPEIAPAEFRAFLKEHARNVPPADGADLSRSTSSSSLGLGRKRSMLRRQYQPRENDGVEEEKIVPLSRNRSYLLNPVPQLNFTDLQRLEQLAEEASENDDSSKLRTLLRRSLSLNLSPSAVDKMDNVPDMGDEADAPIIVPPPGQILRRAARTKIRKPALPGDGGGHRFGSTRRGARAATLPPTDPRNSSDLSSSDHGDNSGETDTLGQQRRQTLSDDGFVNNRPDSFSEVLDAYLRDADEDDISTVPVATTSSPPSSVESQEIPQLPLPEVQLGLLDTLGSILQPQPQRHSQPQSLNAYQPSRTPSPPAEAPPQAVSTEIPAIASSAPLVQEPEPHLPSPPIIQQPPQPLLPSQQLYATENYQPQPVVPQQPAPRKDKKGGLFKWGGDKSSKKSKQEKDKDRESRERPEKDKDSGFFGALFGGSKKRQDADFTPSMVGGNAGREAAQALLGASKSSKNYVPPTSPALPPGANPYARYPIHVERAIYRLSHIKLANPRRPLYEQVLISNLMFWYLGIINKTQTPAPTAQAQPNSVAGAGADGVAGANSNTVEDAEQEQREREQREQEQREKTEKERLEKEKLEREKEVEMKKKESGKRGSLTKTPVGGVGGRRAEMPIKGPQYEMQHRVMEQEYENYNSQSNQQVGRSGPVNGIPGQHYPRPPSQQYSNSPPKLVSPQSTPVPEQQFYDGQLQQQRLPPGAMPPVDQTASWMSQNNTQQRRSLSPQRSRTPPQNHIVPPPTQRQPPLPTDGFAGVGVGGGRPSRSLSANAIPPPQTNGAKVRKGQSIHAISPVPQAQPRQPRTSQGQPDGDSLGGEEEDTPLATLRQQQRRVL